MVEKKRNETYPLYTHSTTFEVSVVRWYFVGGQIFEWFELQISRCMQCIYIVAYHFQALVLQACKPAIAICRFSARKVWCHSCRLSHKITMTILVHKTITQLFLK